MSRQSFRDRSVAKQSSSVFNQLPRPRLQRLFGSRSALFTGVERDRLLEKRRNMTTEIGVQRKLILAGGIIELNYGCPRNKTAGEQDHKKCSSVPQHFHGLDWRRPHFLCCEEGKTLRRLSQVRSLLLALTFMLAAGCSTIKRKTEVKKEEIRPQLESSEENLVASYNEQARAVETMQATVDLIASTGSTYSGVIEEYHDVTGFILAQRPATVRVIGQAPVVAKNIFDMVSDGKEFRIYIPSRNAFLVGPTTLTRSSSKPIENLRPNHIVEALFWPEMTAGKNVLFEQFDFESGRYYILTLLREGDGGKLEIARKIWYDRVDLRVSRVQLFGRAGCSIPTSSIRTGRLLGQRSQAGMRTWRRNRVSRAILKSGVHRTITKLEIHILKLTLNEPISADRFVLAQPEVTQLVHMGGKTSGAQR